MSRKVEFDPKLWGIKSRNNQEYGYASVWYNLETFRVRAANPLPPTEAEFYDVSLGRQCNMECNFCYTDAKSGGRLYPDVVAKIRFLMNTIWKDPNKRPYQVAIGSEGEPTIHPEFGQVLETFWRNGIVPNYTTNGRLLASGAGLEIMEYTKAYVGGVALSANPYNPYWEDAFRKLRDRCPNTKINLHLLAHDIQSADYIQEIMNKYDGKVWTFVILPMIAQGRAKHNMTDETYMKLVDVISRAHNFCRSRVAVGARMYPWMTRPDCPSLKHVDIHEPEKFSKNLILDDPIRITPSSFDTNTNLWTCCFNQC